MLRGRFWYTAGELGCGVPGRALRILGQSLCYSERQENYDLEHISIECWKSKPLCKKHMRA